MRHITYNTLFLVCLILVGSLVIFNSVQAEDITEPAPEEIEEPAVPAEEPPNEDIIPEPEEEETLTEESTEETQDEYESNSVEDEVVQEEESNEEAPTLDPESLDIQQEMAPVIAEEPVHENINIGLRIETLDSTILDRQVSVPYSCEVIDSNGSTSTFSEYKTICALQVAKDEGLITFTVLDYGWGLFVDSINNIGGGATMFWSLYQNNNPSMVGATDLVLTATDKIVFSYVDWNYTNEILQVTSSLNNLDVNTSTTLQSQVWNGSTFIDFDAEVDFIIDGVLHQATSGTLDYKPQTDGQKEIYVEAIGKTRSEKIYLTVNPSTQAETSKQVNLNLRYQNDLIFSGQVTLPTSTIIVDSNKTEHLTTSTNVLTALLTADDASTDFDITDLQYYESYGSFYLNCLDIYSPTSSLCGNWNYIVEGNYPSVGMDGYPLNGGENIYVYYNNPWQITASTSTFPLGATTTFSTWLYNYNNLENEWILDPNNLIDISIDNPNSTGWWDTTITVSTTSSNTEGNVDYIFSTTGTYYAKITSLDWSKWSNPITITVNDSMPEAVPTEDNNNGGNVGSGSSLSETEQHFNLNVNKAIEFLSDTESGGHLGSNAIYTDWSAIAFGAYDKNHQTARNIKNYLLTDPNTLVGLNKVSDYARRAMALMSLNINPYSDTQTDYITALLNEFDGTQFGDPDLYNDDIFAIIPLLHAGYNSQDKEIYKTIEFILSKQNNGWWGSVDLTAATVQALSAVTNISGVSEVLALAKIKLQEAQTNDGGFGNTPATAWSMQAIASYADNQQNWLSSDKTPGDFLYTAQADDGGVDENSSLDFRIWNTAYAIPAALGKDWNDILQDFTKPLTNTPTNDAPNPSNDTNDNSTPTSTLDANLETKTPTSTPTSTIQTPNSDNQTPSSTPNIVVEEVTKEPETHFPAPIEEADAEYNPPVARALVQANNRPEGDAAGENDNLSQEPEIPTTDNQQPSGETLSTPSPSSTPYNKTTKGVFAGATSMAGALGLYLGWRFLQTLV